MFQTYAPCQPFHGDLLSPVRVTSGWMVQHLRCGWMRLFAVLPWIGRIENGLKMLQGLLIIQLFPPKHMIFLSSFELAFVQYCTDRLVLASAREREIIGI